MSIYSRWRRRWYVTRNNILKQIPTSVEVRLTQNSSNSHIFERTKNVYQTELANSGYDKHILKFNYDKKTQLDNKDKTRCRKRKIIWFTPPYNKQVITTVGHIFMEFIKKTLLPKHHELNKILENTSLWLVVYIE